jgi:hypothetical protein
MVYVETKCSDDQATGHQNICRQRGRHPMISLQPRHFSFGTEMEVNRLHCYTYISPPCWVVWLGCKQPDNLVTSRRISRIPVHAPSRTYICPTGVYHPPGTLDVSLRGCQMVPTAHSCGVTPHVRFAEEPTTTKPKLSP